MRHPAPLPAPPVSVGLLLPTSGARAQTATGRVTDESTGKPLRAQAIGGVQVHRRVEIDGSPGVCVRIRSGGCALVVWNGQPLSEVTAGLIPPMSLEAVVLLTPMEATLSYGTDGGNPTVLLFTGGMSASR